MTEIDLEMLELLRLIVTLKNINKSDEIHYFACFSTFMPTFSNIVEISSMLNFITL